MKREQQEPTFPEMEDVAPSLDQLIECVRREIGYRKIVYARRIAAKRMSQKLAEREIRLMEYVYKNLVAQRAEG